ncbi:hypothetical protein ABZT47_04050 [Sphaerisporangium sp. NPDC005289]|uniref:hypothetical protein n=1 Tax=Sphaerisporangium sp. NPDC005289 TaxID=3155247 RepID=UPI0033B36BF2
MNRQQDTEDRVVGGFITDPELDVDAGASGCCGEPASGPVEIELVDLGPEDSASGCCGEPSETSSGCCGE